LPTFDSHCCRRPRGTTPRVRHELLEAMRNTIRAGLPFGIAHALVTVLLVFSPLRGATPAAAREIVAAAGYSPGTIVIRTSERRLYFYLGDGKALRYPVGVGRAGKQWSGTSFISGKYRNPDWAPPAEIRRDKPYLPAVIPGGSPHNPMGVAALTLADGEY